MNADDELAQWLRNGEMAQHNPGPGLRPVPVVVNGKPVATKPGNWQGSEHDLQTAVFEWAESSGIPELAMMFAIPNGQYRTGMRMEPGLKSGVPDFCLPVARGGYHGLYIELKVGRNQPTEAQRDWLARLEAHGYKTAVCRDLESVQALIVGYVEGGGMMTVLDCRSEEGVTVGLIDSIITISHVLATRDLNGEHIAEALADLRADSDVVALVSIKAQHDPR